MKRSLAPLSLLLALAAASASAQEFGGMDDYGSSLSGIQGVIQQQKLIPQGPQPYTAMGASGRDEVSADSVGGADGTPDVSAYPVRGIDVSHYQKAIDWSKVKTDGLSFVYVKATEGSGGTDERFAENWAGAKSAGLARGAYHFYNFCERGPKRAAAQAANFIKTVPPEDGDLPPTIDLEQSDDCKTLPAKAAFRKDLAVFAAKIQEAYGHAPIMYVNHTIYNLYFKGENDSYRLWIADTKHVSPDLPDAASWTMWQYTWHGQAAGIGEVDLDVFNGSAEMFAALPADRSILVARLNPDPASSDPVFTPITR